MIKGIEKLTKEQIAHMERVNELHTKCVGLDYKEGMNILYKYYDSKKEED